MARVNPLERSHFGFGGKQYMVEEVECEAEHVQYVTLPDNRIVCLRDWTSQFSAYGQVWDMSIPTQPTRVELFKGEFGADFPVYKATLNDTGKNFLVQRLSFESGGVKYRVNPEVYGDCLIWEEDGPAPKPVLIRLPSDCSETFCQVTRWSEPGCPLEILEVEITLDIYQLGPDGNPILEQYKTKDEQGNPVTRSRPVHRPYVWATYPPSA